MGWGVGEGAGVGYGVSDEFARVPRGRGREKMAFNWDITRGTKIRGCIYNWWKLLMA